ncbi:MAG TPA: DUF4870 domain-containing protein [Nocardioidaceae bacterium]|nr:DUF4870 domain-containing protein [Nocardioidaceae bacterium]
MPGQPAPGQPMQSQPMSGAPMRPDEEKMWAIGAHIGPLLLGFVAPLVVWLVFKDRSAFLNRHGKEALNFQISYFIYFVVATFSLILLIGFLLLPVVGIAWLVFMIIAAVKASNFEDYRYPLTIRLIK